MADEEHSTRPSFWSPIWAAIRQGAKEFAQYLPAFPDSMRPIEEPGTLGNPTPQMVTAEMGNVYGYDGMLDRYAERGMQRNEPEQEMER